MQYLYYSFFFLIIYIYSLYIERNLKHWDNKKLILQVFILCFSIGLYLCFRDISSDFVDYRLYYNDLAKYGDTRNSSRVHEFLYQQFQLFCIKLGFSYPIVYLFNIILMLFPITVAIIQSDFLKHFFSGLIILYLLFNLWLIGGCLRQMVAIAFVFIGLLTINKNIILSIIYIVIAGLFHRSGFILLAFVPIFKYIKIPPLKYQLIIYFICYIITPIVVKNIDRYVMQVATLLGHSYYENTYMQSSMMNSMETGSILIALQLIIITLCYNLMKKKYGTNFDFYIVYKMFFYGTCLWIIISRISAESPIARANYLFYYTPFCYCLALKMFKRHKNLHMHLIYYLLLVLFVGTFIKHIAEPFYPGLMPLNFVNFEFL